MTTTKSFKEMQWNLGRRNFRREEEEAENEDDGTIWNVDYSVETGRAYRVNCFDKRSLKEYTADFSC